MKRRERAQRCWLPVEGRTAAWCLTIHEGFDLGFGLRSGSLGWRLGRAGA